MVPGFGNRIFKVSSIARPATSERFWNKLLRMAAVEILI